MSTPAVEILSPGMGVTIQDLGRPGWKHLGVPGGGAMDLHSAVAANRLVGNPDDAPVLEWLMHGGHFRMIATARIAVVGAGAGSDGATSFVLAEGGEYTIRRGAEGGLWTYVAVGGRMDAPRFFGSASAYPRGGLGRSLMAGERLSVQLQSPFPGVARRIMVPEMQRTFSKIPAVAVWPGPQRDQFAEEAWARLIASEWTVSSRSDRVGYRLEGPVLPAARVEMRSEPMVVGSLQVPPDGQPIVTMRDGPTVGGYPKLAVVDEDSLDWLAQVSPGVMFRFVPVCE